MPGLFPGLDSLGPQTGGLQFHLADMAFLQDRGNGGGDGGKGEHDPCFHEQGNKDGEKKDKLLRPDIKAKHGAHGFEKGNNSGIVHRFVIGEILLEQPLFFCGKIPANSGKGIFQFAPQLLLFPKLPYSHGLCLMGGGFFFRGQPPGKFPVPFTLENAADHVVHLLEQKGFQFIDAAATLTGAVFGLPALFPGQGGGRLLIIPGFPPNDPLLFPGQLL